MKLYFVSRNESKIEEITDMLQLRAAKAPLDIELMPVRENVQEILSPALEDVVRLKAYEAYRLVHHPCVVEHGGLFFDHAKDFPGVFGRIVWRSLQDRMTAFLRDGDSRQAVARAYLGYCDGRRIHIFRGETTGEVAQAARGEYNRNSWDPIFIPRGSTTTYGEMGMAEKRSTSPLIKAWELFLTELDAATARDRGRET
ncbi:MAG: hypothetical protein IT359_12815 [Gemmatimonadaceae bacterium]|nr:hypothetical protein [Gemmatimonadaceae bacterium]